MYSSFTESLFDLCSGYIEVLVNFVSNVLFEPIESLMTQNGLSPGIFENSGLSFGSLIFGEIGITVILILAILNIIRG